METTEIYREWLTAGALSEEEKAELAAIASDPAEIEERFYRELEFGTAGLRGVIRQGTNGMNRHVVRRATQGLADYMNGIPGAAAKGVVIAYDSRRFSDVFAKEAACVLAANGIRVRLFSTLHSVPQLSYAVRHQGCEAGIVITASHNPAKYNGYKVYWAYGGQCTPAQADEIYKEIQKVPFFTAKSVCYDAAVADGSIGLIGAEEDAAYYEVTKSVLNRPELLKEKGGSLPIVYTPLHGAGNVPVNAILKEIGITNVYTVPEQQLPDGNFPTVKAPNPEDPDAFTLATKLAEEKGATVILATDPDSDRLGISVKTHAGDWVVLTGNQIGCILLNHIITERKAAGTLPENALVVKSIVSTTLADAICEKNGVKLENVLTGFRFISEKIDECERTKESSYLFGFEESFGFLAGGFSRDKDAVCSAMLAAEACIVYAERGMTLYDALQEIYATYGIYKEKVSSYTLEGKAGMEKIKGCMQALRDKPFTELGGVAVAVSEDYAARLRKRACGCTEEISLPKSDMLRYVLEDGSWLVVRPSGTEPKLKLYTGANAPDEATLDALLARLFNAAETRIKAELA
ncbi:MAG: phospho-sugar mutase [Clostridia bacterium]|nr:phospho-sugar mutase [Clostridia bacterium]